MKSYSAQIRDTVADSSKVTLKSSDLDFMKTKPSFKSFMQQQNDRILRLYIFWKNTLFLTFVL